MRHFHKWNLFPFLVGLYKKIVSCFSGSFCQFLSRLSDGSHYVTNKTQLVHKTQVSLFLQIHMKNTRFVKTPDYCIAHLDDKTCFLPSCKYHILLLGNVEELLKKLDTFCFTHHHLDCLYTLFKYRFSGKVNAKRRQVFHNVQRAVDFNQRNTGVDGMPSIAKKRLLRKKYKKQSFSSF